MRTSKDPWIDEGYDAQKTGAAQCCCRVLFQFTFSSTLRSGSTRSHREVRMTSAQPRRGFAQFLITLDDDSVLINTLNRNEGSEQIFHK